MSHPSELPLVRIQEALPKGTTIRSIFVQNPSDGTLGKKNKGVRLSMDLTPWVSDAYGNGQTVADAVADLIGRLNKPKPCCRCNGSGVEP